MGEKIRMSKLGCKGKSSSAKITASGKIFGVLVKNQFSQKEKCPQIRRIDAGNVFLCPRKLHCPPNHQQKLFETLCSADAVFESK